MPKNFFRKWRKKEYRYFEGIERTIQGICSINCQRSKIIVSYISEIGDWTVLFGCEPASWIFEAWSITNTLSNYRWLLQVGSFKHFFSIFSSYHQQNHWNLTWPKINCVLHWPTSLSQGYQKQDCLSHKKSANDLRVIKVILPQAEKHSWNNLFFTVQWHETWPDDRAAHKTHSVGNQREQHARGTILP